MHRRILESLQTSRRECFGVNSLQLKVANWIRKNTPSQIFEGVLDTPLKCLYFHVEKAKKEYYENLDLFSVTD